MAEFGRTPGIHVATSCPTSGRWDPRFDNAKPSKRQAFGECGSGHPYHPLREKQGVNYSGKQSVKPREGKLVDATTVNLFAEHVPEIQLPDAPLVKVVAQVRYPRPLDFSDETTFERIAQVLGSEYPVGRKIHASSLLITPGGMQEQPSTEVNWTYQSVSGDWQVTASGQFISLETSSYTSRAEFCDRLRWAVEGITTVIHPPVYDRLGVRYINRLEGEEVLADLHNLVRPVARAGLVVPHEGIQVQHSLCDTVFIDGNSQVQARWGWLPAGTGFDLTVPPPPAAHWLLDIDSFTGRGGSFDIDVLDRLARDLSDRAYSLFRWIITDEFIDRFGGKR